MTDTTPEVERISVLTLEPGDVIVARVSSFTTQQTADRIQTVLEQKFPGHTVVVTSDVELSVVREVST